MLSLLKKKKKKKKLRKKRTNSNKRSPLKVFVGSAYATQTRFYPQADDMHKDRHGYLGYTDSTG